MNRPGIRGGSADDETLIVGGHDGVVRRYDGRSLTLLGPPVSAHDGGISSIDVDPDGSSFATSGTDGAVNVWDTKSGFRRFVIEVGPQNSAAWVRWLPTDTVRIVYDSGESYDVDLQLDAWLRQACNVANRSLTNDERAEFLTDPDAPSEVATG